MSDFLTTPDFPYCKGCGHHHVARNTIKAFESLKARPLDVVMVTDIGCHGIVDRCFATHTVHGLHGRSVAVGAGIAMGLPPGKKVVVYIGDGGATIGLQHILEAARLNVDLTVVVHNNMLYGMTGGQPSGLTPCGFRTVITPEGSPLPKHNLPQLALDAGAPYASRVLGTGDFSATLREAIEVEGFALVEVLELCTSYATKWNPELKLRELAQEAGHEPGVWRGEARPAFRLGSGAERESLLAMEAVAARYESPLEGSLAVLVGGSAGEGVQRAAELFAQAAMACGLHATKKGRYPVTVGVGFSVAEVIISHEPILYHGISGADVVIATSEDGLRQTLGHIQGMQGGTVWLDASLDLEAPATAAEVQARDFRGHAGARSAALYALLTFVQESGVFPVEALVETVRASSIGKRVPAKVLAAFTPS